MAGFLRIAVMVAAPPMPGKTGTASRRRRLQRRTIS
jgi:hypothetical protein